MTHHQEKTATDMYYLRENNVSRSRLSSWIKNSQNRPKTLRDDNVGSPRMSSRQIYHRLTGLFRQGYPGFVGPADGAADAADYAADAPLLQVAEAGLGRLYIEEREQIAVVVEED